MLKMKSVVALCVCLISGVLLAVPGGKRPPQKHAPAKPVVHARPTPPRHHAQPVRRHPAGARHWVRPACPPPRRGALRAWTWVEAAWTMTVNGIYSYGEGYYFDGYNYFYNGAYYTTPPVVVAAPVAAPVVTPVVTQPVVVTPAPVVTQPVVVRPVVVR